LADIALGPYPETFALICETSDGRLLLSIVELITNYGSATANNTSSRLLEIDISRIEEPKAKSAATFYRILCSKDEDSVS
jgi:hypothetical protein